VGGVQRRAVQRARGPAGAGEARPPPARQLRHADARPPLGGTRCGPGPRAARHVHVRARRHEAPHAAPGARPRREEAALLARRRTADRVRERAEGAARRSFRAARRRPGRDLRLPHVPVRARTRLHPARRQEAPGRPPARVRRAGPAGGALLGAAVRDGPLDLGGGRDRGPARAAARGRARAAHVRRAAGRVPLGRHRFERGGGVDDAGLEHAGQDLQHRLRGGGLERAGARARGRAAPGDRSPRADRPPPRAGAAAEARVGARRTVRRRVHGAHVPRLGDGARPRDRSRATPPTPGRARTRAWTRSRARSASSQPLRPQRSAQTIRSAAGFAARR